MFISRSIQSLSGAPLPKADRDTWGEPRKWYVNATYKAEGPRKVCRVIATMHCAANLLKSSRVVPCLFAAALKHGVVRLRSQRRSCAYAQNRSVQQSTES